MSATRFHVVISSLRASDVTPKDASGTSDPYLKINFDNFKQLCVRGPVRHVAP